MRLVGKDLLFIGFWTDWNYLNEIFAAVLEETKPAWVVVVDPGDLSWLATKAPQLSAIAADAGKFVHERMSSDEFLDDLRSEFSKVWMRRFYSRGRATFDASIGASCPAALLQPPPLSTDELYDLRRDIEGVPLDSVAQTREPAINTTIAAVAHLLLRHAGAVMNGSWWSFAGRTIRIVNGGGRSLSGVRQDFEEPGAVVAPDIVICAGALDLGVPGHILRSGVPGGVVRPGARSEWLTLDAARAQVGF
jgi:hypothetical protein